MGKPQLIQWTSTRGNKTAHRLRAPAWFNIFDFYLECIVAAWTPNFETSKILQQAQQHALWEYAVGSSTKKLKFQKFRTSTNPEFDAQPEKITKFLISSKISDLQNFQFSKKEVSVI